MMLGDLAQSRSRHPELNSAKYAPMKEASALAVEVLSGLSPESCNDYGGTYHRADSQGAKTLFQAKSTQYLPEATLIAL
jgi:hypothetical protein